MKEKLSMNFKNGLLLLLFVSFVCSAYANKKNDREYYKLVVYHYKDADQEKILDNYFQNALLPALHRIDITNVGVFKSLANDTVSDKLLYLFVPVKEMEDIQKIDAKLQSDATYNSAASEYLNAPYNKPAYTRMETIILYAFPLAPKMQLPQLTSEKKDRVYELRSYESASEKIFQNKVKMFNDGDEVGLFKRLGFNAVFYSSVVAGSKMPNLMYMTTFNNMQDREAHWKSFGNDDYWKKLSSMPEYQNNVQHIDITFLHPTDYSDF